MKNAIRYYYNMNVDDIHQNNKNYRFYYNGYLYVLTLYEDNIEKINEIYNMHVSILQTGLYCHQIILNIENMPFTKLNEKNYILLKVLANSEQVSKKIDLDDIIYFSKSYVFQKNNNMAKKSWIDLWSVKTDYIEYQINQFGIKYPIISEGASYYIGMAENAISYLVNNKLNEELTYYIAHRRLSINSTLYDLYNPINFIVDYSVRDVCEYAKNVFFDNKEKSYMVYEYIKNAGFNYDEIILLLARFLYPTYYFDMIQDCIDNKKQENDLWECIRKYVSKVDEYEAYLKNIFEYFSQVYNIELVEWIITKK